MFCVALQGRKLAELKTASIKKKEKNVLIISNELPLNIASLPLLVQAEIVITFQ